MVDGDEGITSRMREEWPLDPAACLQGLPTQHHPCPSQVIQLAHLGAMILFGKAPAEVLEVVGAWRKTKKKYTSPPPPPLPASPPRPQLAGFGGGRLFFLFFPSPPSP